MKKDIVYPTAIGVFCVLLDKILPEIILSKQMVIILKDVIPYVGMIAIAAYFITVNNKRKRLFALKMKYHSALPESDFADAMAKLYTEQELKLLGFRENEIDGIRSCGPGMHMALIVPRYNWLFK